MNAHLKKRQALAVIAVIACLFSSGCGDDEKTQVPKEEVCKPDSCAEGLICDTASGKCIAAEKTSSCEGIEKPSGAEECTCQEGQWKCSISSEPTEPETDKCKDSNCPSGQQCDPETGDCIAEDEPSSDCEGIAKPSGAAECTCQEGHWDCTFPSEPTEPEPDKCKDSKCSMGQKCDPETGKCVDAYQTLFLYTEGKDICTKGTDGKCQKIQLRGFNLGMWLSRSIWGLPIQAIEYKEGEVQSDVNNLEIYFGLQHNDNKFTDSEVNALSEALYDHFISIEDIDTLKDLAVNLVRVPFEWSHLMSCDENKQNCHFLSEDDSILFKHMDWIVDECGKRGIYVIFDLHVAQGNLNTGGHREKAEFLDEPYRSSIVTMWKRVSNRYKDISAVAGYDLVNEPEIDSKYGNTAAERAAKLADFYDILYKTIRGNGDNHIVFMEEDCVFCGVVSSDGATSNGYSSRGDIGLLPDPKDKKWENVAYSVHNYFWTTKLKSKRIDAKLISCFHS
ncbi:MAG: cellulase family glycosylhydrolase [Proteobacteria bacterium]|nr:cellulase family glycosylhydrolase [Pseudomonadota bacterium]